MVPSVKLSDLLVESIIASEVYIQAHEACMDACFVPKVAPYDVFQPKRGARILLF